MAADQMFLKALTIAIYDEKIFDKDLLRFNPEKNNPEFLEFYTSLDDYSIYNKIIHHENAKTSKLILNNIKKRKLLKRACEFTPKNLENAADVNNILMKMKPQDFDNAALESSNSLGLESHEVLFFKSTIKNKLYKEREILFRVDDDVYDLDAFSPISGTDVDKFLIYGPRDKEIRKKIVKQISERFGIDLLKRVQIQ